MPFAVDFVGSPRQSNSEESEVSFISSVPYTSQIGFSYLWDFGDGSGSTEPNPTHKYEAEGAFTVTLTVSDCTGWYADTAIKQDYITIGSVGIPEVIVNFYGAPTDTFVGETVYFYNNTQASYDSSLWDFGDGTGSSEQHPTHAYQSAGVYSVSLQVLGSFGAVGVAKNNYIQVLPAAASDEIKPVFKADPINGKSPHVVQFSNLTGGTFQDIWWDFGDGMTSTDINPLHTYEQPGNYTVTLSVGNNAATKLDYICTVPPEGAFQTPAGLLLSGDPENLQMMGAFRDSIMARGIYGTGLLELYYKHALELVAILQGDPALFAEVQALLALCLSQFEASLASGAFDIPDELQPEIMSVLGKIADQASPDLSEAIIKLMRDWDTNEFFQSINCGALVNG
jgi:PKD repeat protein